MFSDETPDQGSVWLATAVAAPLAASAVSAVLLHTPVLAPFAFVVALAHAVALGLPAYLLTRRRGWANLGSALGAGVAIGVAPIGLLAILPVAHASAYSDGAWTEVDGVRTAAGWVEWGRLVAFLAANGAAAGLAFWATIRVWPANRAAKVDPEVFA